MQLSRRITGLTAGGSDGWDLFRKARRMIASGVPVVELTIGEHDIRTDPRILDAMDRAARGGHTGYAAVAGTDALRAEIARRVAAQSGVATTPENVPPSVHDEPAAELSADGDSGPSVIWNALSLVLIAGRTCTATSRYGAPGEWTNC